MDCCNYPEYRAPYGWEGAGYTPYMQYTPYAQGYYPPLAHEHYARLAAAYRYDAYHPPQHVTPNDHISPMEYGGYATKEGRARRGQARRDALARTASHHLPLPPTPPLECGVNGRGSGYGGEPQMWPHYQANAIAPNSVGWHGMSNFGGAWMPRVHANGRDHARTPIEMPRAIKAPLPSHNQVCPREGRTTPFRPYEESPYSRERARATPDFPSTNASTVASDFNSRDRYQETRRPSPEVKKPPAIVPLPAFQQAFGSTEIGRFAEAFSRTEVAMDDSTTDNFNFEAFSDWDGHSEPLWSSQPAAREIKCEDNL